MKTLLQTLSDVGGWPVLLGDRWNETEFDWQESVYKITSKGYVIPLPATIFVGPDSKDTSKNVLKVRNNIFHNILSEKCNETESVITFEIGNNNRIPVIVGAECGYTNHPVVFLY